jgi:ribose-phosphate pyrophosphokinase
MILRFEDCFTVMKYPSGEPHVRRNDNVWATEDDTIIANAYDFNDLAMIVTADRILQRDGSYVTWIIPFMPCARHDRRNDNYDGDEIHLAIGTLERNLGDRIRIIDPHSDVAGKLPHYTQSSVVEEYKEHQMFADFPHIVIPDAGAAKKAYDWIDRVPHAGIHQAIKKRNPVNGRLSGFQLTQDYNFAGETCVIIDDICDGGGTFLGLAKVLKEAGAGQLLLGVTHGLFTKGLGELNSQFDIIYSLNT